MVVYWRLGVSAVGSLVVFACLLVGFSFLVYCLFGLVGVLVVAVGLVDLLGMPLLVLLFMFCCFYWNFGV